MNENEPLTLPTGAPEALTDLSGLTEAEAARRLANGEGNAAPKDDGNTPLQIAAKNLFTRFNLLNVLLAKHATRLRALSFKSRLRLRRSLLPAPLSRLLLLSNLFYKRLNSFKRTVPSKPCVFF